MPVYMFVMDMYCGGDRLVIIIVYSLVIITMILRTCHSLVCTCPLQDSSCLHVVIIHVYMYYNGRLYVVIMHVYM